MLKNFKFIIFVGLIAIGIAASNNLESEDEVIEVQKLLKMIQSEVDSSHRNDKRQQSESKNGNDHNLMNIQTLNQIFKHNNLRSDTLAEEDDLINKDAYRVNKLICAITGSYGCSKNDDLDKIETDDDRSLSDADLVNEDKKELQLLTGSDADTYDPESIDFDEESINDLESVSNGLEKKLLVQETKDLRCRGNRCGRGILRDREMELIRCKGDTCELRIKQDNKSKNQLRCKNNGCGKHRYDDDNDNRHADLRCGGHRCGRSRANDDKRDDLLRCRGHRCGRDRADDDGSEDDGHDHLRCRSNRCKKERAGDNDVNNGTRYNTGKGMDELRCKGYRCRENSDDEYYDDRRKEDSRSDESRYLKKPRNYYHNYVMPPKENYLPYGEKLLKNHLWINKIRIVPGKDNKVIVPASSYFGLTNEVNKKIDKPLWRSEKKRLLPLTMKQKKRMHLQGEKEKALAPFVLDVKGLGQVNL